MNSDLSSRKSAFKEYDIRGAYPDEVDENLTKEVVKTLAEKVFVKGKVLVGRDGRNSSPSLYQEAINTLKEFSDIEVVEIDLVTTPTLYFLVNDLNAVGGLMITASHNEKEFNGIKAVREKAEFIGGKEIYQLL